MATIIGITQMDARSSILDKPRSSAADYLHLLDLRSEATKFKKSKISATKVWVSIRGENYVAVLDGKIFKERPARAASGHAIHATNLRRLFPRGPHTAGEVRRFQILEQNFAEDRDRHNDRDAK